MTKQELERIIESFSPAETQEEWDNSGWQIRTGPEDGVTTVLTALEICRAVIGEAERAGAQVIVTHHPLLFSPLRSIDEKNVTGNYVAELIRKGISVYSSHTPFDKARGGNNDALGERLGFTDIRPVEGGEGFVRAGRLPEPLSLGDLVRRTAKQLGIPREAVRFVGAPDGLVRNACWCTGSGGEFLRLAGSCGADVYLTGDVRYHDAMAAYESGIAVIDAGHYGTEILFRETMADLLSTRVPAAVNILRSQIETDPFSW